MHLQMNAYIHNIWNESSIIIVVPITVSISPSLENFSNQRAEETIIMCYVGNFNYFYE